ncbi:MAG TPA: hypothetical protein DHV36_11680 [Desulfobacteraceae bacterium]|nr:hypothetical protein [Desulfobacteraceae bacterium]
MSVITDTSVYSATNNPYLYSGETAAAGTAGSTAETIESETAAAPTDAVSVSLSGGVADARLRENMGLNPTGRLTLGDFRAAADTREEIVAAKLGETMAELGLDPGMELSLSVDADYNIAIAESFPGKAKLQKALNEDPEFELAYKQMTANREVADYADSLTRKSASLVSFMSDDASWEDILSMARKYDDIKSGAAGLTSLLGMSKTQNPYTYTYTPEA